VTRPTLPRARLAAALGLIALLIATAHQSAAQTPPAAKKVLTLADCDGWRTTAQGMPQGMTLSRDGQYLAYYLPAAVGGADGELIVRHIATGKEYRVARGGAATPAAGDEVPPTAPAVPAAAGGRFGGGGLGGGSPQFTPDSKRLIFTSLPTRAELEKAKVDKAMGEAAPRGGLAVMDLATGTVSAKLPPARGFTTGGSGAGFLIYHKQPAGGDAKADGSAEAAPTAPPTFGKGGGKGGKGFGKGGQPVPGAGSTGATAAPAPRAVRTYGADLVIRDLTSGRERTIADVDEYSLTRDGKHLVYTVASRKDQTNGVFITDPTSQAGPVTVKAGPGRYSRLSWDEKQSKLAFLFDPANVSTDPKVAPPPRPVGWIPAAVAPKWRVFVWDRAANAPAIGRLPTASLGGFTSLVTVALAQNGPLPPAPALEVLGPDTPGQRKGWSVAATTSLTFSPDGTKLFLATGPTREPAAPTPAAPASPVGPTGRAANDDKVDLDIWHWKDNYIQPMQKVRGDTERNRTYSAVVLLDTKQFRQVSDESLQVGSPAAGDWAVGSDDKKYLHLTGYGPSLRDYAFVNVRTGEKKTALTAFQGTAALSPGGKHLITYDGKDWCTYTVPDFKKTNLTANLKVKFFNEEDDHPDAAPSYGLAGWTADGSAVLVYDRYDLWKLAADGSSAENLTRAGRAQGTQFRHLRIDLGDEDDPAADRRGIDTSKPMLLSATNLRTRDTGFFRLNPGGEPKMLVMGARLYGPPAKAKSADVYLLTVQSFFDPPDYYTTTGDFHELRRVTDVNPRAREFNWGKAELIHYHSADGVPLSGMLIKPENFDPNKKYPMMVYIYERLSQNVHRFVPPTVGTSINATFYASNGYLVFMPDIAYKVGSPGQSALKCVLPAISAVCEKGYVKEDAIGIQGHSWGGYQIAYMVTQTNRFKAAAAGAPVSDMVSAYGGIRWGSGLPRQFQYERTQSRIGGTLWEAPMKFIENSPIFMADRVQTPLLMLHNDQDDAVPWYQGIEYYLALRRLGKECYLLNYNGELHGLRKRANQRDYTMRMFQFFEHHLNGKPAPEWMEKGVPFAERDKEKEQWKSLFRPEKK
jgi:dipeptidyl aminopeptidase/acylaminoacyl peptidase